MVPHRTKPFSVTCGVVRDAKNSYLFSHTELCNCLA